MSATFSPSQVAAMTGVSLAAVRSYCERFNTYFSPGATPPKGNPREFGAANVKLVAFIRAKTAEGLTHDQVAQAIDAGELTDFTQWQAAATGEEAEPQTTTQPQPTTALLTTAQGQALQALLEDYRQQRATDSAAGRTVARGRPGT